MRKRCTTSTSPRGMTDTGQYVWSLVWTLWMTVISLVLCHALHVPQHVAVSLSEPLKQKMISSAPSTETVFAYLVTHVLF